METKKILDQEYWDNRYKEDAVAWDLGMVSPPIKEYIDQLENKDIRILIPGCGNTHEAEYLLNQGFTNITVIDISPTLIEKLQQKFSNYPNLTIRLCDFFEHSGEYDLVLEQTFFCALHPDLRPNYVAKMHNLLTENGKLVGVFFNHEFPFEGPPFGALQEHYIAFFEDLFHLKKMEHCHNSAEKRKDEELFIHFIKK